MRGYLLALLVVVLSLTMVWETAEGRTWRRFKHARPHRGERQSDRHRGRKEHHGHDPFGVHAMRHHSNRLLRMLRRGLGRHSGMFDFDFGGYHNPFNLGFSFDFGRQRDWWEGPNVCRTEETDNGTDSDSDTITHHFKTAFQVCEESDTAYKCKSTVQSAEGQMTRVELYSCCHGYSRKPGEFGCPQLLRLRSLLNTAQDLGLEDFVRAVRTVGLEEELARSNFTVFAPVDGSFPLHVQGSGFSLQDEAPHAVRVSQPMLEEMESELRDLLLGHVLPEPRRLSSFSDEDVIETGSPLGSTIRINFFSRPEKLTTANCVRVTATDQLASNGVLHVVEKLLPTVTYSLMDLIQRDEQFSFLKTALARANLVSTLQKNGQFTLLAPTNSAFRSLDQSLLDSLLKGDAACLEKVLKQHLLSNVICSAVIQGRAKSRNLLGNYVNLTRTEDNKVFADGAQVVAADMMATNGVLHIIDGVLVPDDALDVVSVAGKQGLTELAQLLDVAGLTSALENAENITVFAPSNEAIQAIPAEVAQQLTSDPTYLRNVLTYHVIPEQLQCRELYNGRVLDTLNAQGKVRVNEYSTFPFHHRVATTVQCASVLTRNVEACNGVVHVIDKVMLPPTGNVIDVLAADPNYGTLVKLLKLAGLADALQADGPFTIFAPTNRAFDELGKERMKELEGDREQLASVLKEHVYDGNLCCAGVLNLSSWWRQQQITTLGGGRLYLSRDRRGRPLVSDAVIGSCDNIATNGVVQGIDSVLQQATSPWDFWSSFGRFG